jgi:hypothetical protein
MNLAVSQDDFMAFVNVADASGFKPLLQPTLAMQAELLGLSQDAMQAREVQGGEVFIGSAETVLAAEVFQVKGQVIVATLKTIVNRSGFVRLDDGRVVRPDGDQGRKIELSALVPSLDTTDELDELAALAETEFHSPFEVHRFSSPRFSELKEEGREEAPTFSVEFVNAAQLLVDRATRSLALAIKASGGLLIGDLEKQLSGSDRDRAAEIGHQLESAGLIARDVVVICRKSQAQINRLPSLGTIESLASQGVRCACGRQIDDERAEEAVTVTDMGRELLDGSKWFSILLVDELLRLHVAPDRILIEQESGGDEMDCIADISGEVVFFELKDKEFSLGNAYSFGAKMGIVRPEHPVIVTSEYVGNDAKDHFSRASAASGSRRYRTYTGYDEEEQRPVRYVEGLDNLRSGLEGLVTEIYRRDSLRLLREALPLGVLGAESVVEAVSRPLRKFEEGSQVRDT